MNSAPFRLDRPALIEAFSNGDFSLVQLLLEEPAGNLPSRRDLDWLWNEIQDSSFGLKNFKNVILSNITINALVAPLGVYLAASGSNLEEQIIPYQQWEPALHAPDDYIGEDTKLVQLILHIEEELPNLVNDLFVPPDQQIEQIEDFVERLRKAFKNFRSVRQTPIILNTFILMHQGLERLMDRNTPFGRNALIELLNTKITALAEDFKNLYIFDYASVVSNIGRNNWYDGKNYFNTLSPISPAALTILAQELTTFYQSIFQPRSKVLVVDLDNTIWGGIVGEDGPEGLQIADNYPGNAYRDFQKLIKDIHNSGVALAIASKNNAADAKEAFELNPNMPLQWEDFAATEINWGDKSVNIQNIANTLNVGLDSIVFIDDNPLECELVKMALPEISVIHLGEDAYSFREKLLEKSSIYPMELTQEDEIRNKSFHVEKDRRALETSSENKDDFLFSLNLQLEIGAPSNAELKRVVQLINKTNQFNLTTRRYDMEDILNFMGSDDTQISIGKLSDKFGEYGIISVQVLKFKNSDCLIDTFLMSCRVLGRKIEDSVLCYLAGIAKKNNADRIIGEYNNTKKNNLVAKLYEEAGFQPIQKNGFFELTLEKKNMNKYPSYISVHERDLQK